MDTNGSIAMFDYQRVSGYMELYVGFICGFIYPWNLVSQAWKMVD